MFPAPRSTILIIGASGRIGRALAQPFAQAGWQMALHFQASLPKARETLQQVESLGGIGKLYQADIRHEQQTARMIHDVHNEMGGLEVMIVAAGCACHQLVIRTSSEQWAEVLDTNLTGVFHCLKSAGLILSTQKRGSILVIGSLSGLMGSTGQAAYSAAKAGLIGLVKTAAWEWGTDNVRINVLLPGWQASPLTGPAFPTGTRLHHHALKRTPELSSIAEMAYHIVNLPDTSGQIFNMDSRIW